MQNIKDQADFKIEAILFFTIWLVGPIVAIKAYKNAAANMIMICIDGKNIIGGLSTNAEN